MGNVPYIIVCLKGVFHSMYEFDEVYEPEVQESFPVKFCKSCKMVYELDRKEGLIVHKDFPTYGLERDICSKCK